MTRDRLLTAVLRAAALGWPAVAWIALGPLPSVADAQEPAATSTPPVPTFARDVAPIVFEHCTSCHRPGEVGPFPLMDYQDVRRRGRMIARLTRDRVMPPWLPVEGHGEFVGSLRLSATQIDVLQRWVAGGMPEGDPQEQPPLPEFVDGWTLGEPDLVLRMPEPFEVPADGPDLYRNFLLPMSTQEDRWVTAIEVRPGSRASLHHLLFHVDTTGAMRALDAGDDVVGWEDMSTGRMRIGADGGGGLWGLGGWSVGATPQPLPDGLAMRLPGHADFIVQSHLQPIGKPALEQTTLGLYFAEHAPEHTLVDLQLPPAFGRAAGIDLPPGAADFQISDGLVLPVATRLVSVFPHAHQVCTGFEVFATLPGGDRTSVFLIDAWDFDWQGSYTYREPLELPAGSRLEVLIRYDNSAANPNNPHDPPQRVQWGLQTADEMGSVQFMLVPRQEIDLPTLLASFEQHETRHFRRSREAARRGIAPRLMLSDRDGDGRIRADEIPPAQWSSLSRLDANGDGFVDHAEMAAAGR